MKITAARVIVCSPGRNFVTLKIETAEGIYGIGDATLNGRELAVVSYLEDHLIPCLIGRDARQIEDIWQYFYRGAYWRRGPVGMTALTAIDVAVDAGAGNFDIAIIESEDRGHRADPSGSGVEHCRAAFGDKQKAFFEGQCS